MNLEQICNTLYALQVDRKFVINLEVKLTNTSAARIVSAIGLTYGEHGDDEATREKVWSRAKRIVAAALNAKQHKPDDAEIVALQDRNLNMLRLMFAPLKTRRDELESEMERLAGLLPVASFCDQIAGFKLLGLAVIVAEAGDLNKYSTYRKLWRRCGLGMAQGHEEHAYSTWRRNGGLTSEEWIMAKYSPKRLGQIYGVVTIPLFMQKSKHKYGATYDARRQRTMLTHPEWWADANGKPKVNPKTGEPSSAHAMEDAKRVMVKHLLADLWKEWRASETIAAMDAADRGDVVRVGSKEDLFKELHQNTVGVE